MRKPSRYSPPRYRLVEDVHARDIVRDVLNDGNPSRIAKIRKILDGLDDHLALTGREVRRREEVLTGREVVRRTAPAAQTEPAPIAADEPCPCKFCDVERQRAEHRRAGA